MEERKGKSGKDRLAIGLMAGSDAVLELERDLKKQLPLRGINDLSRQLYDFPIYWERVHITPNYFDQAWRWDFGRYNLICNMVTDPDRNPETLKVAERLSETLTQPQINLPKRIGPTARDRLPRLIGDIPGVITPRTIRIESATAERIALRTERTKLRWPLLVKVPGRHSGSFLGVFKSAEQLAAHLEDGVDTYLLTEFANFVSPDGLYRKCRFWCIGERIILRHQVADRSWNLHGRNREALMAERPELRREEEAALERQLDAFPSLTTDVLQAIKERIGLDYFGIDCHIRPGGEVLVFEANATMNFSSNHEGAPEFGYIPRIIAPLRKAALDRLLSEKLARALPETWPDGSLPIGAKMV